MAAKKSKNTEFVLQTNIAKTLESIAKQKDRTKLLIQRTNALSKDNDEIAQAVMERLQELAARKSTNPMEMDFFRIMEAYEVLVAEKNGKKFVATFIWKKVKDKGVKSALSDWVTSKVAQGSFPALALAERLDLTMENLVLRYPEAFEPDILLQAKQRLLDNGMLETELPSPDAAMAATAG